MASILQDAGGNTAGEEQVSLSAVTSINKVIVYISSDVDPVIDCIARMIALARPPESTSGHISQPKPIKIDPQGRTSWWQLVTKYYMAVLRIEVVTLEESQLSEHHADSQAVVVILATHEQDLLLPLLNRLSLSAAESRLVLVKSDDDEMIAEDESWNETCSGFGFECHSASDLREASMSLQCCPWPTIQQCSKRNGFGLVEPLPPFTSHETGQLGQAVVNRLAMEQLSIEDGFHSLPEPAADARRGSSSNHVDGFEDDFAPFVSAGDSSTWEASPSSDDLPTTAEVDETARMLFGHASGKGNGAEHLNDLDSLVEHLNQLKETAALMDNAARRRFAAKVAMAVENRLGPE